MKLTLDFLFSHSSSISAYPSFLRPKGIPEIDYPTLLGIRLLWIFSCIVRNFKLVAFICIKLRIMHMVNWMFLKLQVFINKFR